MQLYICSCQGLWWQTNWEVRWQGVTLCSEWVHFRATMCWNEMNSWAMWKKNMTPSWPLASPSGSTLTGEMMAWSECSPGCTSSCDRVDSLSWNPRHGHRTEGAKSLRCVVCVITYLTLFLREIIQVVLRGKTIMQCYLILSQSCQPPCDCLKFSDFNIKLRFSDFRSYFSAFWKNWYWKR